jgi:predicted O-linked N-acetylglucosamine transferase (SPINDLY family)
MVGEDIRSLQEERKRWDAAHGARWHKQWTHPNVPNPERRLRVGYVSADIWGKSSIKVFGGMLTRYDRSAFDVYVYSNAKGKDDKFTDLFKQNVTVWRDIVGLSDDAATDLIRKDQIDILVDLSGHSSGHRLLVFARKPAPIQVTAWGYASGTGMRAMDVFLTDPVMVPPQDKQYFAEEIRYLPCVVGAFFNEQFPDVNELPALSAGTITFGCFNRLMKVTEETYRVWAEILLATPNSKLILKTPETVAAQARVIENFTKAGVDTERIIMLGGTAWYEHMQAHHQLDLALDPFPHGGGVTSLESLMMGVPVVTLLWPTMAGRVTASIMTALGLPDWIAKTREQYIELAIQKARDLQSLAALRKQLRSIFTSSVMGDQVAYTRAVEQEYRKLWKEWCEKAPSNKHTAGFPQATKK